MWEYDSLRKEPNFFVAPFSNVFGRRSVFLTAFQVRISRVKNAWTLCVFEAVAVFKDSVVWLPKAEVSLLTKKCILKNNVFLKPLMECKLKMNITTHLRWLYQKPLLYFKARFNVIKKTIYFSLFIFWIRFLKNKAENLWLLFESYSTDQINP